MRVRLFKIIAVCVLAVIILYLTFMVGRYSFLITKPESLLGQRDKWLVQKAREFLKEEGVAEERLKKVRLVEAVIVYFPEPSGVGSSQVVLEKTSGEVLEGSW